HIISLLGRKRDGFSEFSYYPFRSRFEANDKPTFEDWLNARYDRRFTVHEFPTVDAQGVPADVVSTAQAQVLASLQAGRSTIIVDSAGAERTSRVCESLLRAQR